MRDYVAICFENLSRLRALTAALVAFVVGGLVSCSGGANRSPTEIVSRDIPVTSEQPAVFTRALQRGVYLVEGRERDIDVRVTVEVPGSTAILEDRLPRHGVVYKVVSLRAPADLRVTLASADHSTRHGSVALRIARWARTPEEPPSELESGYAAQSVAGELATVDKPEAWTRAADQLHEALTHFAAADAEAARAQASYSLAYVQYGPRDQYAAAVRACEIAAEAFGKVGDEVGVENAATMRAAAEIDMAAGMSADTQRAEQRALYAEADRTLLKSEAFFARNGLPLRAQYAVNMHAVRAINVGDYETAAKLFTRAVEMARANADVREQSRSLNNLAVVHMYLGLLPQAAREYETLLPLLDEQKQPYQYATLLANYGMALVGQGDFDRALEMHARALAIYTRIGEEDDRAVELAALGGLYFRMGDTRRALETLQDAITAQERVSDAQGLASTLRVAGNAASAMGDHALALDYLRRSTRIDADHQSVARTRVLIASQLRAIGKLDAANAELNEPLASSNPLVMANALEERAQIRLTRHDTRGAVDDLRTADAHYIKLGLEYNRIDTITAISNTLLALGDVPGAGTAADEAISIVSRIRVKTANPEWRARFLSSRYTPYEARLAADFASSDPDAAWRAFRTAEAVRARSLTDEIAGAAGAPTRLADPEETALRTRLTALQLRLESNIQRQGNDEPGTFAVRRAIAETRAQIDAFRTRHRTDAGESTLTDSLQKVQRELPADTAVLAYFVGDDRGYAWLLSRASFASAKLPGRETLERAVLAAQREERAGNPSGASSRALGLILFQTLLGGVRDQRLLVLADGPLNSVSFAALPVPGHEENLLVDRFVVANAPSLALAMSRPAHARSPNTRVAVIADPVYAPDDRRIQLASNGDGPNLRGLERPASNNLTRLPWSALEASAVTQAFGATETIQLSGFDAVPERVLGLPMRDLAVLHFATHAVARADAPDQSALYLTEYGRDGALLPSSRLTALDIARSGLRADVVVLSGCATGEGSALRGEGVLGLAYGFLANGSHSVVASLWPVEDASTARFMSEFYRAYRTNGRAADALRTAQLRSRASGASGVWSSFVVRANEFP
jgi:CHAT domain-containing protein/tetratricopeptide (TPR) repeat protein